MIRRDREREREREREMRDGWVTYVRVVTDVLGFGCVLCVCDV